MVVSVEFVQRVIVGLVLGVLLFGLFVLSLGQGGAVGVDVLLGRIL